MYGAVPLLAEIMILIVNRGTNIRFRRHQTGCLDDHKAHSTLACGQVHCTRDMIISLFALVNRCSIAARLLRTCPGLPSTLVERTAQRTRLEGMETWAPEALRRTHGDGQTEGHSSSDAHAGPEELQPRNESVWGPDGWRIRRTLFDPSPSH